MITTLTNTDGTTVEVTVPMMEQNIEYLFRAVKDDSKLRELVKASQAKGHNHIELEEVQSEEEGEGEGTTMTRRKAESYKVMVPDFIPLMGKPLGEYLNMIVLAAVKAEGQAFVNVGTPLVDTTFNFDKIVADTLAGKSKAASSAATVSRELAAEFIKLFVSFLEAKGVPEKGIEIYSKVLRGRFSPNSIAAIGIEGTKKIIKALELFKVEVLDTDDDLEATFSGAYDSFTAKGQDAIKPKETDFSDLLSLG